jgi:cobalamin biosynthesis Co2+ chelatase CbiK
LKEVADTYRGTIQIEVTGLRSSLETLRKNSQEELARHARIVRDFTHDHHIHVQNLRAQMVATQDTVAQRVLTHNSLTHYFDAVFACLLHVTEQPYVYVCDI